MSGDVQPRKRKDKKRKKDDSAEQIPSQPQVPLIPSQSEDVNIHVHKEDGTGGGFCAKIVFFLLFSVLAVLVGLILTEHRGLTDLDTADQESRFSQIFEGWIDNSVNHEDDHDEHIVSSLEDEEHDEHDENESPELDHDEEDEQEDEEEKDEEVSEEVSQADDEEEDSQAEEDEVSQAEDEQTSQAEDEDEEDEDEDEDEETAEGDETLESEEQEEADNEDESEAKDDVSEDKDEEEEEEEEEVASREAEKSVEEDEAEGADDDEEDEVAKEGASEEEKQSQEKESEEVKEDDDEEEKVEKDEEEVAEGAEDKKDDEEKQEGEEGDDSNNSKSVNVRHDNEPEESDSEKQSDDDDVETYEYENITNKDDLPIKEKIDEAQKNIQNNAAYAIKLFDVLLQNYPSSPRSLYGKALALDLLADQRRSNEILQKAIAIYLQILDLKDVPDALYEAVAERCINRLRFMGNYNRAIDVHNKLILRFPDNPKNKNQLVVSYLTINRVNKARVVLQEVLAKYPNDGFALVHYGFILKTVDNNLVKAVLYLKKGIATKEPGVIDGRFYFHLGDALARLGKNDEAMKVYEEGVKYNLFLSKYQRSLYNVARLKGKPWWKKEETPYSSLYVTLESNWEKIREEGLSVLMKNGLFQNESENLKNTGDWKQFELFARGQKNLENCKKCPFTCKLIETIPDARGCRRGQTKFSVMHPKTHVWPHCGPTNCRLRVHLGLHVPEHTYIRVANETRSWKNGKVLIFDDSFEHEVWHNGTTLRLVLIVDVWHPQLTAAEKKSLLPI